MARTVAMSIEDAEVLALRALAFLATDTNRLTRFLTLTGLQPAALKQNANKHSFQAAVLSHLLQNESELLVFASEQQIAPDGFELALRLLNEDA
jgi:hypothetical protein